MTFNLSVGIFILHLKGMYFLLRIMKHHQFSTANRHVSDHLDSYYCCPSRGWETRVGKCQIQTRRCWEYWQRCYSAGTGNVAFAGQVNPTVPCPFKTHIPYRNLVEICTYCWGGWMETGGPSDTHLSCFKAYSNILILLTRSFFKFSWPFLSPCRKAIWAWKHKNRIVRFKKQFTVAVVINRSMSLLIWHLWHEPLSNKFNFRSDNI